MGNTIGKIYKLTTFGESHGEAMGGIIDGCPAGLKIDFDFVQNELNRRRPGQSAVVSPRNESDTVLFLSGILNGITTGTPIGFTIKNENHHSGDYDHLKDVFRPSHADYTYQQKYTVRDHRGGGRTSARETVCRVVAGAIAKLVLAQYNIAVQAYTSRIGQIKLSEEYTQLDLTKTETNAVRCPDAAAAEEMIKQIEQTQQAGDTLGGVITCIIKGAPAGLGEPVFDKLHAQLAYAVMGINAVKGFEYGSGFAGTAMNGSQHNDAFSEKGSNANLTNTNHSGGIQGGISNGEDIYFNTAFKPIATIMQTQNALNAKGEIIEMKGIGRHDVCVVPRAVPIVEAMAALVMVDFILMARTNKM